MLQNRYLISMLMKKPHAWAMISGSPKYPMLSGNVRFYQTKLGVLVAAEAAGLPSARPGIFGFHIHGGDRCTGTDADPFADALAHYDPYGNPHPLHAGDLPPLFENQGYAFQIFLTDRFSVRQILHKTVIIHSQADDFTTQPGGNAGARIGCGRIVPFGNFPLRKGDGPLL